MQTPKLGQIQYTITPVLSGHSKKKPKKGFRDRLLLNAGQKFCRMFLEHSAILLTFIKLPFVIKTCVLSIYMSGRLRQVLL